MPSVLITDSLFIGPEEESDIRSAGYEIERLDVPAATEAELVAAIKGKVGYVLGGIESVTDAVITAADELRVIAFTGSGFKEFIPAWESATERGIAISAARGANAIAVAEFAVAAALTQVRQIPRLMTPSGSSFSISREFSELTVGVIGYGSIGRISARKFRDLGFNVIATTTEPEEGIGASDLADIVSTADVVSVHVSKGHGDGVLDARRIAELKDGVIVVNVAFKHAIDNDALVARLRDGTARAALDYPLTAPDLPLGSLLASNGQTAFNTEEANKRTSVRATTSLLALLSGSDDPDLMNPEYAEYR